MRLVFLGPPGAGKGTQAARLSAELGLAHVSTGDLLRKEVADGSPVGKKAEPFMKKGGLVPDEVVIEMVLVRIRRPDAARGFVLDGFPRTEAQAAALDRGLGPAEKLDRVVYFDLPDSEAASRLSGRFTCRSCGKIYNVASKPPKAAGRCDACGGELYQRDDDKAETIVKRLDAYRRDTVPLVAYYSKDGRLVRLPAERREADVASALRHELQAIS